MRAFGTILCLMMLASISTAAVFLQETGSGMVGYWKCDETSGPSTDFSGNNYNGNWSAGVGGAAVGATSFSTGSLAFNGATAQVTVPGTAALTITGDVTVAFWMNPGTDVGDW